MVGGEAEALDRVAGRILYVRIAQYTHASPRDEVEKEINGQPLPHYYTTTLP